MSLERHCLNRRAFMKGSAALLGMTLLSGSRKAGRSDSEMSALGEPNRKANHLPPLPGYRPGVTGCWIPQGNQTEYSILFKKTLEAATDFSWLSRGDKVLLKLALNSGNPYPATTDPWALWCMVKMLKEKGAGEVIVGDQSGMEYVRWFRDHQDGASRDLSQSSGLLKVIEETGAESVFFEERGYDNYSATAPPGCSHWDKPIWVTSLVNEVDHIIYMARVSSHVLADITSGFKIGVGFLREDSRRAFHRGGENFYHMYEEINHVPEIYSKLRLTVSSGRWVLTTFGPDNGYVARPEYGLLIASQDLLSHELLAYAWLNWNRCFKTPSWSGATVGKLTRYRSRLNKLFVWMAWKEKRGEETPPIALWQPGDIYQHPSVVNFMKRKGGRPEHIAWEQINSGPDRSVTDYLSKALHG